MLTENDMTKNFQVYLLLLTTDSDICHIAQQKYAFHFEKLHRSIQKIELSSSIKMNYFSILGKTCYIPWKCISNRFFFEGLSNYEFLI
jgi:hypothetical protein